MLHFEKKLQNCNIKYQIKKEKHIFSIEINILKTISKSTRNFDFSGALFISQIKRSFILNYLSVTNGSPDILPVTLRLSSTVNVIGILFHLPSFALTLSTAFVTPALTPVAVNLAFFSA